MKIDIEILQKLMEEVNNKVEGLMHTLANRQTEINELQYENKQLRDNYAKILTQIDVYVKELEEIKNLQN